MLEVSDIARDNLKKVFESETAENKQLVIYFQGFGWGGPVLGMALEESIDGLHKMESNSIIAYVEPQLQEYLEQNGKVRVDYRENSFGGGGYMLTVGDSSCDSGSCGGSC